MSMHGIFGVLRKRDMQRVSALLVLLLTFSASAQAQQSTLIIRSDANCALTVNGMPQGQVTAGSAKAVPVGPGEHLVECVAAGGAKAEQVLEVFPGAQKVVKIELAGKVELQTRFQADANRVLDTKTGLTWLASDNGSDIDWQDTRSHCAAFSPSSYSLPTMDELQTLVGAATKSPLFKLSSCCYWSNESNYRDGSSEAWGLVLGLVLRLSYSVSFSRNERALCVRRRS